MELSTEQAVITGKYRAQQKFIQDLYSAKWKRQLSQNIKPKWLDSKYYTLYQEVHSKKVHSDDRGVLLTISPGCDAGMETEIIDILMTLYHKLVEYKNFIPKEHVYSIETLCKDGITSTHPHLHIAFPNLNLHSKTQYINRTFSALQQLHKKYKPNVYFPMYSRQSVDVTNKASYRIYREYVLKNVSDFGADPSGEPPHSE